MATASRILPANRSLVRPSIPETPVSEPTSEPALKEGGSLGDALPEAHAAANFRRMVLDIGLFGLGFAAVSRFLSVFAIHMGATPGELSLMASLPAVGLLISSFFGVLWMQHFKTSRNAHRLPSIVFRLSYILPIFALVMPEAWRVYWIIASVVIPSVLQGPSGIAFTCMMRDGVRSSAMTRLLGRRGMWLNITHAISALSFGLLLEKVLFPYNYAIMFVVAFALQLLSDRQCATMQVLPRPELPAAKRAPMFDFSPWKSPGFREVALTVLITHIAVFSISSIVPLHLVHGLGAKEGFIAIFGLVELASGAGVSYLVPKLIGRLGYKSLIATCMVGMAISGMIIALAQSLPVTLLGAAIGGASWTAGATIGLFGYLTQHAPANKMAAFSSAYHQVIGIAVFIGPLFGGVLAGDGSNLVPILIIGAMLRLAAAPLVEWSSMLVGKRAPRPVLKPRAAQIQWVEAPIYYNAWTG